MFACCSISSSFANSCLLGTMTASSTFAARATINVFRRLAMTGVTFEMIWLAVVIFKFCCFSSAFLACSAPFCCSLASLFSFFRRSLFFAACFFDFFAAFVSSHFCSFCSSCSSCSSFSRPLSSPIDANETLTFSHLTAKLWQSSSRCASRCVRPRRTHNSPAIVRTRRAHALHAHRASHTTLLSLTCHSHHRG